MSKTKIGQQLILSIMDMAREAGLDAKNFIGRGTNVLKFPKQDEITPYKPNFLQSMKEFGQDSITAVKNKLQDEMNFLTTSSDMDLQNYKNNLQDYLDFVVKPKQKREGIMGAKSAELVDIKTGKPFDPNVKTNIEERMGVPKDVDLESPMGGLMGSANKLKALIDDIEGITPGQRAAMDAKSQKEIIEEFTTAGGKEEDIVSLLRESVGDVDYFKRNVLPKAKTVAEMNPKNQVQLQLGIDAEDTAQTFGEDGIGKVIGHFEKYYNPSQVRYTMEDAIENEIVKIGKANRDDVSEALLSVKRNAKQEDYFAELKDVAKKFDYDLDTTFYKNYEDTYTFRNDPKYFERLMKNVKIEDADPDPFAEGGRVEMKIGGLAKLFKNLLKGDDAVDLAKQEKIFREGPITAKFLDEVDQDVINPFVSTRDMSGRGGYGLYKSFDEMPAGLKAAELVNRIKTKDGGIDYERAEAFIGKKLKGNESIDELIEMIVTPQRIERAYGGLADMFTERV